MGCIALERHIFDFAISPDEKYIATAEEDGNAKIFAIVSKAQIGQMSHGINVWAVAFSPKDGQYLATGSEDGTVRVWRWRPEDLMSETCQRLPRNLGEQEWRDFLPTEPSAKTCPPDKMLAPLPVEAPPPADDATP